MARREKGLLMGNRGDLHAVEGSLGTRLYAHKSWISCLLDFKERRVTFDTAGKYYPLFFLDEAVALAAGHRPCGTCRRQSLRLFKTAWCTAAGLQPFDFVSAKEIDVALHRSRTRGEERIVSSAGLSDLPNGTMLRTGKGRSVLWLEGSLLPWSWSGYRRPMSFHAYESFLVLTPDPLIGVLRNGYVPAVHPTAQSWGDRSSPQDKDDQTGYAD